MQVEWYGQSAFRLTDGPRPSSSTLRRPHPLRERGLRWDYPRSRASQADLLLVTHEHFDHNGVGAIAGDPPTLRSTAGRLESPIGEVLAVASEHDDAAGTERGPNTLFAFTLGGRRVAHLGDFGQARCARSRRGAGHRRPPLRARRRGPTIGAEQATAIAARLGARVVVPMHYRSDRIDFLEPVDAFAALAQRIERLDASAFDLDALPDGDTPLVVVPAAP
jgi:L-ascorbate metabolism protein UlaG (beta-lactamase superfamily)